MSAPRAGLAMSVQRVPSCHQRQQGELVHVDADVQIVTLSVY